MQWIVDKVPDQSLLNTAGWRFIVPQLYKKYPNDDMNMNISLSTPPVIKISPNNVDAIVYADLIIDVLESQEVIPVACISLVCLVMELLQSLVASFYVLFVYLPFSFSILQLIDVFNLCGFIFLSLMDYLKICIININRIIMMIEIRSGKANGVLEQPWHGIGNCYSIYDF